MDSPTSEQERGRNGDQVEGAERSRDALAVKISENRLMSYMDLKFEQLMEESDGLKRKLKSQERKEVKFEKNGHKVQFEFNNDLLELISTIQDGVKRQRTTKVQQLLEELVEKIEYRNKLIQMADRSPYGWATVNEYEKDQLAADELDEKRINNSEKGAEKKDKDRKAKEKEKAEKDKARHHPYRDGRKGSSTFSSREKYGRSSGNRLQSNASGYGGSSARFRNAPHSSSYPNNSGSYSNSNSYYNSGSYSNNWQRRDQRHCFGCGRRGHIWSECPDN